MISFSLDSGFASTCFANGILFDSRNQNDHFQELESLYTRTHHSQEKNALRFVPYDEVLIRELKLVQPFVYWGYPTFKTVNDLLHKKALFQTKNGEKVRLCFIQSGGGQDRR